MQRHGTHLLWLWILYSSVLFCFVLRGFWPIITSSVKEKNCPRTYPFFCLQSNNLLLSKVTYSLSLQDVCFYIKNGKNLNLQAEQLKMTLTFACLRLLHLASGVFVFKIVVNAEELKAKTLVSHHSSHILLIELVVVILFHVFNKIHICWLGTI